MIPVADAPSPPAAPAADGARSRALDDLRTALTALVIVHHAAITFGADGNWFFRDPAARFSLPLTIVTAVNQSFFMGLFFGVAGHFSGLSLARKGARRFLADRALRLGVPALFFGWVLHPIVVWLQARYAQRPFAWPGWRDFNPGPLWFTLALLLFCVGLVVVRRFRPAGLPSTAPLGVAQAPRLVVAMAALTIATRCVFPLGVNVLWFQVGYFPQYVLLFAVGVASGGTDFLARLPRHWLAPSLLVGATAMGTGLAVFLVGAGGDGALMRGGTQWQAVTWAVLECVQCVAFCVAALLLAREHAGRSRLGGELSRDAFGAYVLHAPLLVAFGMWASHLPLGEGPKFLLTVALAIPASFLAGAVLRRLPLAREIF
ncbi:MAG: acyltransferase family protein [Burkholderiales bacterium]